MRAPGRTRCAAQYIRMSTDRQDLSPDMQREATEAYARQNGLSIINTYFDAGKSGLTLTKRPEMRRLLSDVTAPTCPFSVVLVYDVSRWGRFQDTDASAYYEYHCRLHGIDVRYVTEAFSRLEGPLGALLKSMKRAMAAEYSRELAVKTTAGHTTALTHGFQLGTRPALGIARVAVSKADGAERALGPADHKSSRSEHVRWVPGPADEVEAVQRIFEMYAKTEMSVVEVARAARALGIRAQNGRPITEWMLYSLLRCEAFVGDFVWGRAEQRRRRDHGDPRIRRKEKAVHPIITRELFDEVQAKLGRRAHFPLLNYQLIEALRTALERNPRMMATDLKANGCACRETLRSRFGSLEAAWRAAGYELHLRDDVDFGAVTDALRTGASMCRTVANALVAAGVNCVFYKRADRSAQTLLINGRAVLRTQVIWRRPRNGTMQWCLRKIYKSHFDWILVVRLASDGRAHDSILVDRRNYFSMGKWLPESLGADWKWNNEQQQIAGLFRTL